MNVADARMLSPDTVSRKDMLALNVPATVQCSGEILQ